MLDSEALSLIRKRAMEHTCNPEELALFEEKKAAIIAEYERENAAEAAQIMLHASGLEHAVKSMTFDAFKTPANWQRHIKDAARKYAADPDGKWFFVGGQSGSGKTHLCTAIVGGLLNRGRYCRYFSWRDEVPRLRGYQNTPDYDRIMREFKSCDVLYVDDLYKGKGTISEPSDADVRLVFELLNYRANNQNPTIISSEYNIEQIISIDEAIGGRIRQHAGEFVLTVDKDRSKNHRLEG